MFFTLRFFQVDFEILRQGRIGPVKVNIDEPSISGEMELCMEQAHLLGKGNFTSARADVCVFANKWMYEVTLGSGELSITLRGILQLTLSFFLFDGGS